MICSQLQKLAKEVDQYSTFVRGKQFTIDALKVSGIYYPDNPYVKELLNSLYEFTDLHHQVKPTKRKEKSDDFTTSPSSKISKFNDIQPNFQIELANRFNVLSQETAENLPTDSASTTIPNTLMHLYLMKTP
ncbi:hypothetical protein TNCV_609211 [Trichonephila clavipes]|nr:hypothetical protein TNCV_609211 [Trichonephila clavipes]